jgi:hypothetical protein
VNDITRIIDGDIMGVILDNGAWHWTNVNGPPESGLVTMRHAVPLGKYIPKGAVIITYRMKAMGPLAP